MGTCASCGGGATDPNCGACIASGSECFNALMPADRQLGVFMTSDGHDARSLTFGKLVRGAQESATDINRAVSSTYNSSNIWLYYGTGTPPPPDGYCAPAGGPPPAFSHPGDYVFGWDHRYEDTMNGLDCYNGEVDRFYLGASGHADGSRVCDGEQGFFDPSNGAIYDLGGEANRVVVFPITDHDPLPCEAFEYSLWLSNNPDATEIADPGAPDPNKWNPATMIRAFQQGWTRNIHAQGAADAGRSDLSTYLRDTTDGDAIADALVTVWALPCGLTFRYVAMEGGNYGNPGPECTFHSSEDELDAVAGLNEDDTAICVDADGDGHRDIACGGDDCDDSNAMRHPGAFEPCDATMDLNCLPMADCPSGTVCDGTSGLCVPQCFEGGCADGFTCVDTRCVDSACAARTDACPAGTLCRGGDCVGPCDGVVCPDGQQCQEGACIDPCLGVVCPANQVCVARDPSALTLCGPSCACTELAVPHLPDRHGLRFARRHADRGACASTRAATPRPAPTAKCAAAAPAWTPATE